MYGCGRYNRRYRSQVWIIDLCRNDVKVEPMPLIITGIIAALFFDFVNGFHDAANAIATVVGTRVLKPIQAVGMAALANFIGPFVFGTAIAATVGKGIIQPNFSTAEVILAGLVGAIVFGGFEAIIFGGVEKVLTFLVVSPVLGFVIALTFGILLIYFLKKYNPGRINRVFGKLQIASSAFFSLTHGANDGQKTMGVITALLITGGFLDAENFEVPIWVILSASIAIAFGTFLGGWRIVKTMAFRITELKPYQGFCAETGGGVILTAMAWLGIPVSTTHAIAGAIMGVGTTRRLSAVRWGIGKKIIYAWIITIPASAGIGALVLFLFKLLGL
jgi:PiT family inorganic phosphate transporter